MSGTKELFTPGSESFSLVKQFRRIPLSSLRVFEAAGRTGSFAAAAREVDLSPSAVSHAIRKLEESAGMGLFVRTTRSLVLTREGRMLLEHVQRGFEEMQRGFQRALPDIHVVPLRLHTAPAFATQWLMPRLGAFMEANPGIALRFSADTRYATFDDDDHDIDIVYGTPATSRHEVIPLVVEELTPMCSPRIAERITGVHDLYATPLVSLVSEPFLPPASRTSAMSTTPYIVMVSWAIAGAMAKASQAQASFAAFMRQSPCVCGRQPGRRHLCRRGEMVLTQPGHPRRMAILAGRPRVDKRKLCSAS